MFRPKVTNSHLLALLLAASAVLASACASAPEENLIRQYFRASGLRDNQTLANFAVVSFDPKAEGTVNSVKVMSVTPERVEPLKIQDLAKALADSEAESKAFQEKKKAYQDAHMDAIDRVLKAEGSGKKPAGADAAVQAEWTKWRDDTAVQAKKTSAARTALADARPIAELSLSGPNGTPPEISELYGNMVTKDVTIDATVKAPDGSTSQKQMVVTMQRAVIKTEKGDRNGKWIITGLKPA